ncbi:hypothetical protein HK099_001572, partial [Clydaea vesicula]
MKPIISQLFLSTNKKNTSTLFSITQNADEITLIVDQPFLNNKDLINLDGLYIINDKFKALQVDNLDHNSSSSGNRITNLTEPLASAGLSIFYLSTYQTDFIFVKKKRLTKVIEILKDLKFKIFSDFDDEEILDSNLRFDVDSSSLKNENITTNLTTLKEIVGKDEFFFLDPDLEYFEPETKNFKEIKNVIQIEKELNIVPEVSDVIDSGQKDFYYHHFSQPPIFKQNDFSKGSLKKNVLSKNLELTGLNKETLKKNVLELIQIIFFDENFEN